MQDWGHVVLTMSSLGLTGDAIGTEQDTGHEAKGAIALSHNVGLHVSIIVLAGPHEAAG